MSRTTLTPKTCGLLLMETTEDSSARYSPLSQTIGAEYVFLFAMSRTIAESLGRCYLLPRTIRDEYVFNSIMSNQLSDRYPCRGVLHTPHIDSTSTPSPLAGRLVGRMQYAPTFPEKDKVSLGMCFLLSRTMADKSVFHFSISNRLSDGYPGRGVLNTPPARLSSTPTPFAGRLVRRMQYAPTLSKKDKVSSGRCYLLSRTKVDKYVFLFSMSNRLSDRYPGRAQKHTPLIDSTSTLSPFAGRLVGRMLLRPYIVGKRRGFLGYVFSIVSDNGG